MRFRHDNRQMVRTPSVLLTAILFAVVAAAGCSDGDIAIRYGERGGLSSGSVNGTTVLGEMFKQAGQRVESRRALTPYLREVNTIVWMPDNFKEPGVEVRQWFESWLSEQPGRTLVYVARDFDAAPLYWQTIRSGAPPDQQEELKERYSDARSKFAIDQSEGNISSTCRWFTIERPKREHQAHTLAGEWSDGIDPGRAKIMLYSKLKPSVEADALLKTDDETLVARQLFTATGDDWDFYYRERTQPGSDDRVVVDPNVFPDAGEETSVPIEETEAMAEQDAISEDEDASVAQPQVVDNGSTSQLITVVNGSFLLNYPLVNHEHRKLAGKLIAETEPEGHTVFLESGSRDPQILAEEPDADYGPGLKYFGIWPVGPIILHLAVLGIIFCFARWPIFGTPLLLPAAPASDFGKHVRALGKLLGRTKDRAFAGSRLEHYHTKKRES